MIQIQHLSKAFGTQTVLNDVTCHLEAGKIHGLVGNNGSGKTVLMKCICGFLRPDRGTVTVGGLQVGRDCDFPPSMGIILETPGFLPNRTGMENLRLLAALNRKISQMEIRAALLQVGLDPAWRKPVSKYSLGMRQRLGLAQAIMEDPSLLILDEPFNGLDKAGRLEIRSLLLSLKQTGKTILLASHNPMDIQTLCDTAWEIDGGKMTAAQ